MTQFHFIFLYNSTEVKEHQFLMKLMYKIDTTLNSWYKTNTTLKVKLEQMMWGEIVLILMTV